MSYSKEQLKQLLKIVIIGIIIYWVFNNLSILKEVLGNVLNILYPFILGACIAFIFNIPMQFFEKLLSKGKKIKFKRNSKRILSILLSIIVICAIILLIIELIIPQLINVCSLLLDKIPYYIEESKKIADELLENEDIKNIIANIDVDTESIKKQVIEGTVSLLTSSISIIGSLFSGIANLVIAIVFAVYILVSKEKLKIQSKRIINAYFNEEKAKNILKISSLSRDTFKKFITGQVTEACILGTLCAIGMLILNIPYAITIGVLIGVTALIPIVGAFIGVIVGTILIVAIEPFKAVVFIVFFLILQQIEGNLIYPKVVGNSVGLPGLLVLFAVTVGGNLFGIVGMLIGLPIVSILYTMIREDVAKRLKIKSEKV